MFVEANWRILVQNLHWTYAASYNEASACKKSVGQNCLMLAFQYACYSLTFWHTVHQAESVTESQEEIIVKLFHLVLSALLDFSSSLL